MKSVFTKQIFDQMVADCKRYNLVAHPTGSYYIVGTGNDIDVIAFAREDQLVDCLRGLDDLGYRENLDECERTYGPDNRAFFSYRNLKYDPNRNVIVVWDPEIYQRWILASNVAKALKLAKREDRVLLFAAMIYGKAP